MQQLNLRLPRIWVSHLEQIAISESVKRGKQVLVVDIVRETLQDNLSLPGCYKKYEHKKGGK